jgi:ABC-type antimicrobial peptide transport system permease subunit
VTRRTGEIGVRLALGASTFAVTLQVLRRGMAPVVWGLGAGLVASLAVTRLIEGMLFGVKAYDTATFIAVPLVLGASALAACLVPALRAARIQPVEALRHE